MTARRRLEMRGTLLLLLLPAASHAQGGQSAIARLGISPAVRTVAVGDSLRLQVQALDARGNVVPGVTIRFAAQGGRFQGSVDSSGVVRGGAPGTVPIAITAMVPNGRPHVEKIEVRIVPGPAARVTVSPSVTKMLAGQRLQLDATVLAASGDARDDVVTWTSSNTDVLTVAGRRADGRRTRYRDHHGACGAGHDEADHSGHFLQRRHREHLAGARERATG